MSDRIAILGGRVFDGIGSAPIVDGAVIIDGSKITEVGPRSQVRVPSGARAVEIGEQFVLPGLINAHDHLSWDVVEGEEIGDLESLLRQDNAHLALRAARNGANFLKSGVTTIRNMGDVRFVDLQYRRAFDCGLLPGPRILASGPWVVTTHAWITFPGVPTCDGPEEVRKFVRANLRAGVDQIKVFVGGELLGLCNTNPHLTYITQEELETAIGEAHAKQKKVGAHIMSSRSEGFKWAVEAGVDAIEHGIWFTEEDFSWMKSKGVSLVLTGGRWFDGGGGEIVKTMYPDAQEILRVWYERVFQSGVLFAVGVDGWGEVGAMQGEVERMVRLGLGNREAIVAATKNGAIVCGMEDRLGTLEAGKIADIVVVDGDPLSDISALRDVSLVIKSGRICYSRDAGFANGVPDFPFQSASAAR